MKLSAATAHIKALSSSALMPRRSVAKTGGASSVLDVIHTPCSDGAMSVDSCRSNATKSITMMDVDPLRRRRDEDEDMSLVTNIEDERFRRKVCADSCSSKDGDSVGDISMGDTVKGSCDASNVLAVIHTPCSDGAMSVDSCCSNATKSITMMDVDPLRRRRDEEIDMSLVTNIVDERFRRKVCVDSFGGKDGDSVGDISMGDTVKGSISSRSGLNGPYWADFELEVARCGDVFGMKISIPYRRLTRSRLKMASRSEISCDVSLMEGTQDSSSMEIGYENDEDVFIEQSFITRRIIDEDPDSDSDDSGDDDDEDEESVTSNLTADVEGDLAFEGLDVQAIDVCQKRMGRMDLDENSNVMEVDDDEDSVVIARYLIKTTEVLDQHKSRRYFTRGLAKLLLKRTRSGLCY